jgi:hypothetical protein
MATVKKSMKSAANKMKPVAPAKKGMASKMMKAPSTASSPMGMMKKGGVVKKAKSGGSFPDLNKDGKVTKADILKGRGVIAKSGTKMKSGGTVSMQLGSYGRQLGKNYSGKAKK